MTEDKRYSMKGSTIFENGEEITAWDCYDLLNELNDEKQYWKQVCHMIEDTYHDLQKKFHNWDIALSKCREENEQLKQSNERLLKMLDNVANFMQKQNKDVPLDDFVEWWNKIVTEGLDD